MGFFLDFYLILLAIVLMCILCPCHLDRSLSLLGISGFAKMAAQRPDLPKNDFGIDECTVQSNSPAVGTSAPAVR